MSTVTVTQGRTVAQVARAARRPIREAEELLAELERDGFAEEVEGVWRLTDWAEARFGRAFRDLSI